MAALELLTWNVAGYTGPTRPRQLAEIVEREPDIVALQEVVRGSYDAWHQGLKEAGYNVVDPGLASLDTPGPVLPHTGNRFGPRRSLNLIAAKHPIERLDGLRPPDPVEAFPEKYVVARIDFHGRSIDVHNTHTPPGSTTKMLKVEFWEAMLSRLGEPTDAARILCGDFNSPWRESDDDLVVGGGRSDPEEEARWQAAEHGFLRHPDLEDVHLGSRQAGERFAVSHYRGRGSSRTACRYDHIYATKADFDIQGTECRYLEHLLDEGLSDHAPVLASIPLGDHPQARGRGGTKPKVKIVPAKGLGTVGAFLPRKQSPRGVGRTERD